MGYTMGETDGSRGASDLEWERRLYARLLVASGDVDALARALQRMATDAELRSRLGAAALRRASARPTWEDSAALFFAAIKSSL